MAPPSRSRTILVVEDDPLLRTFYRSALMLAGYRVVTAQDGIEALRLIDGYRPGAVVLDLGLPILNGRDIRREMVVHPDLRHIPVIVVTGADASDLSPKDYACILQKPVSPGILIKTVEDCLRR